MKDKYYKLDNLFIIYDSSDNHWECFLETKNNKCFKSHEATLENAIKATSDWFKSGQESYFKYSQTKI